MRKVLVIRHVDSEGPGIFGEILDAQSIPYEIFDIAREESLPDENGYGLILVMGGPMGVYEAAIHPFIVTELEYLGRVIEKKIPCIGVCLGSQLLAAAGGGRVFRGPVQEVGWFGIGLTSDGIADPVFAPIAEEPDGATIVFQLHGDTFTLPPGAVRLAFSSAYENQAFRLGENIYGLQFHVESTSAMIGEWVAGRPDTPAIMADTSERAGGLNDRAGRFFREFLVRRAGYELR